MYPHDLHTHVVLILNYQEDLLCDCSCFLHIHRKFYRRIVPSVEDLSDLVLMRELLKLRLALKIVLMM
jgi:hypothetical protein